MLDRSRTIRPKVIDLNLIPPELQHPLVARGVLLLLAALLAGVFVFFFIDRVRANTWARTLELEEQLAATRVLTQKENSRIAVEGPEVAKIEQEIKRLKDDTARYAAKPSTQVRRLVPLSPVVDTALANQPAGLRLVALSWQEPELTLQGRVANAQTVMVYAEKLRDTRRFSKVDVRHIVALTDKEKSTGRQGEEFTFIMALAVTAEGSR